MNGWIVHKIVDFNGEYGLLEDLLTHEKTQFHVSQVRPLDRARIFPGKTILVTSDGYIEDAYSQEQEQHEDCID